jgi:BirA family transcriptional regulator, biotin operon repressor / biotin---[acetyl-CoA-carboxylase] ligase
MSAFKSNFNPNHKITKDGLHLFHYKQLDSTNLEAERYVNTVEKESLIFPVLFVADTQTDGQGSFHKKWESLSGGLYYTFLTPAPFFKEGEEGSLNEGVLSIIRDVIVELTNLPVKTDAPNDLMIGYRKVGGILLKSMTKESIPLMIVGIGINLTQSRFEGTIKDVATSLIMLSDKKISRPPFVAMLTKRLYDAFLKNNW